MADKTMRRFAAHLYARLAELDVTLIDIEEGDDFITLTTEVCYYPEHFTDGDFEDELKISVEEWLDRGLTAASNEVTSWARGALDRVARLRGQDREAGERLALYMEQAKALAEEEFLEEDWPQGLYHAGLNWVVVGGKEHDARTSDIPALILEKAKEYKEYRLDAKDKQEARVFVGGRQVEGFLSVGEARFHDGHSSWSISERPFEFSTQALEPLARSSDVIDAMSFAYEAVRLASSDPPNRIAVSRADHEALSDQSFEIEEGEDSFTVLEKDEDSY